MSAFNDTVDKQIAYFKQLWFGCEELLMYNNKRKTHFLLQMGCLSNITLANQCNLCEMEVICTYPANKS